MELPDVKLFVPKDTKAELFSVHTMWLRGYACFHKRMQMRTIVSLIFKARSQIIIVISPSYRGDRRGIATQQTDLQCVSASTRRRWSLLQRGSSNTETVACRRSIISNTSLGSMLANDESIVDTAHQNKIKCMVHFSNDMNK